ncbi:MAG: YIP1 family protein [Anaerolineaceae bacterium]|nr:YIP1 family protein [Anaerolineaceae bacterium]
MEEDKIKSETLASEQDGEKTNETEKGRPKKPFFESILSYFKKDKGQQNGNSEAIPAPHKLKKVKNARVGWIFQMFYKPRATMKKVADEKESIRRLPLIFITIIVILAVLISAPVKKMQIEQGATIPENFQYWSESQQSQYLESQQNQTNPIFLYGFPFLGGIAGYLIVFMLMSNILYLTLTLSGSRSPKTRIGNVVAWAMVPFGLREFVRFLNVGINKSFNENPGLSQLIDSGASGFMAFLRGVLGNIDAWYLLFVAFLMIGALEVSGLTKKKTIIATLLAVIVILLLQGLPSFLSTMFNDLSTGGVGFYF